MKKKTIAFLMAFTLLCNQMVFPVNNVFKPISVSAGITDTVPEGYTPIYTIDDLYAVRNDLSGNYILMNDIDLSETAPGGDWDSGNGWKPIGNYENPFKGIFEGNGYLVKNMHIYGEILNKNNSGYYGLFGYSKGRIEKILALKIVTLTAQYQRNKREKFVLVDFVVVLVIMVYMLAIL